MRTAIHGTLTDPSKQHPVFDLRHWETVFPLVIERFSDPHVDCPMSLARREQLLRLASSKIDLGPSTPADLFVWSDESTEEKPWLTRIGGRPWREKGKAWPRDEDGAPFVFLGQICFADSADILPFELPGEVALIFGRALGTWISADPGVLEWSRLEIDEPEDGLGDNVPWNTELPYKYHGVIHRTAQYARSDRSDEVFKQLGHKDGGWGIVRCQATSIGQRANLPQGWPFQEGDGNTLVGVLSSYYFSSGDWPLCDVPRGIQGVTGDGQERQMYNLSALDFGLGDVGAIWIYRDREGNFHLDQACG
jgi:hypothetical protein